MLTNYESITDEDIADCTNERWRAIYAYLSATTFAANRNDARRNADTYEPRDGEVPDTYEPRDGETPDTYEHTDADTGDTDTQRDSGSHGGYLLGYRDGIDFATGFLARHGSR